ncbi:hypothetical protein MOX46_006461, partial [Pseudomonas aeruginosa]
GRSFRGGENVWAQYCIDVVIICLYGLWCECGGLLLDDSESSGSFPVCSFGVFCVGVKDWYSWGVHVYWRDGG